MKIIKDSTFFHITFFFVSINSIDLRLSGSVFLYSDPSSWEQSDSANIPNKFLKSSCAFSSQLKTEFIYLHWGHNVR